MASEIRVNKINSSSGVGTITLSPTGVDISGITTVSTLKVGTGVTASEDGDIFFTGVCTATTFAGAHSGSGANLTSLPAANLTGTLPAISAANLTNVPAANITGTLPAISAANLTNVPAANVTGTLPAISAANLTQIPAANIVGVCTSGFSKTGGFGGNLVHISTQEITSNASTVTFSNAFNEYPFYKIIGINVRPEADARDLYLRAQDSGGDMTSAHKSIVHGGGTEYTHNQNSEFRLNYNSIGNAYSGSHLEEMCTFELTLNGFEANKSLRYTGLISYTGSDGASRGQAIMGVCNRSEAVVGLKFFFDSDVIGGGSNYNTKFILYGVNNA